MKKPSHIPKDPGVYFHRNKTGKIIYVGKAANLRNRVLQYYRPSTKKNSDPKTQALISNIASTDWQIVENELEALFLEAELIKRYKPRYNILERDDKAASYIRIDKKADYPSVTFSRAPADDGADYFGPYLSFFAVKRALKFLRKIFPYSTHLNLPNRACLQYHIGLCPGPETADYDRSVYAKDLSSLIGYLKGNRTAVLKNLEKLMKSAAQHRKYELAAKYRNQLRSLQSLKTHIIFSDKENLDLSRDHALQELTEVLGLVEPPRRIEGYDISHMGGTNTVASMVTFTNGVSDKPNYRKFKMNLAGNDDYLHMREVITRRNDPKNIKAWGRPDLYLIDGGKGQLTSALVSLRQYDPKTPVVGLAKKYEQIIVDNRQSKVETSPVAVHKLGGHLQTNTDFTVINLPESSHLIKLLQRIRDESHRFAVSYHSVLKRSSQLKSLLDDIPTIGPMTKKKLLKTFGSLAGIKQARHQEIEAVIGAKKTVILKQYLR